MLLIRPVFSCIKTLSKEPTGDNTERRFLPQEWTPGTESIVANHSLPLGRVSQKLEASPATEQERPINNYENLFNNNIDLHNHFFSLHAFKIKTTKK